MPIEEVVLSLNTVVLVLISLAIGTACTVIQPLRDVTALMPSRELRRAWSALTVTLGVVILLLVAFLVMKRGGRSEPADVAVVSAVLIGACFLSGVVLLSRRTARELLRVEALEEAAFIDPLTGIANRRRFDERLADEVRRARQVGLPLSLLVLDIDHFKSVNDAHGHGIGDIVLKQVATLIVAKIRHSDTACRVGGEEFVVIMPGFDGAFAAASAERLRRAVAETGIPIEGGGEIRATVSLGLATLRPGETADLLFRRADAALYGAKRGGRDRVGLAA